jgi:hypothetical protein
MHQPRTLARWQQRCCTALAAVTALAFATPARAQTDSAAAVQAAAAPRPAQPRRNANVITAEEIAQHPSATDAYDLIRMLRPAWLRLRYQAPPAGASLTVVRDGQRLGPVEELRHLQLADLGELRYYDSRDARDRWGFQGGAIQVLSPGTTAP